MSHIKYVVETIFCHTIRAIRNEVLNRPILRMLSEKKVEERNSQTDFNDYRISQVQRLQR